MTTVTLTDRPRRPVDLRTRRAGPRRWAIDLPSGRVIVLNETAHALWELCDGQTTVDEMVDAVGALFDLPEAQAEAAVTETMQRLYEEHLVHGDGGPS